MHLNTYIHFDGNCEEALKYYETHLGGKILAIMPFTGTPAEGTVPAEFRGKVLHARMSLGGTVLMASDAPPGHFARQQGFSLSLATNDPAEAERLFNALVDKGRTIMPVQKTFWARAFGMCVDQFGISWMINCE